MEIGLGYIGGLFLAFAVILAATSVIGALTLRIATRISASLEATADLRPSFGEAYKISVIAGLVAFAICFSIGFVVGLAGKNFNLLGYALLAAIGFFSNAAVVAFRMRHPERGNVGFGRASWFTAIQIVISLVIGYWLVKLFEFVTT